MRNTTRPRERWKCRRVLPLAARRIHPWPRSTDRVGRMSRLGWPIQEVSARQVIATVIARTVLFISFPLFQAVADRAAAFRDTALGPARTSSRGGDSLASELSGIGPSGMRPSILD